MSKTAYLVLEDGKIFKGKSFGVQKEVIAEVVFTTGMTGYLETLTDQSYFGQTVVQTFPLIGNYGVISSDFESTSIGPKAYIVKHLCKNPSNFRCEENMDVFFKEKGVTGLYGIDTRALTKNIRSKGVMNGLITYNLENIDYDAIKNYSIEKAVESVTAKKTRFIKGNAQIGAKRIALLDFGLKENIVRELNNRGCDVMVYPAKTKPEQIIAWRPDGIMLSNGPGDPTKNTEIIENIKQLCQTKIPIFGICLGHQLMALANGASIRKMKFGHRGANQPVKNLETGKISITTQNHGYVVISESIDREHTKELYRNANDGTCEGVRYLSFPAFTVQFHPEACAGPQDTGFLFDDFLSMISKGGK